MTDGREIVYTPLDELKDNPRNPKGHNHELLGESVARFGYVEPIVVDGRTGYTISGHGRTETLRRAYADGADVPPGVQVGKDGKWLVPTVAGWASKDDTEATAALIALNRTNEAGGWEDEKLLELLGELAQHGGDFAGVGFDQHDLDDLAALLDEQQAASNASGSAAPPEDFAAFDDDLHTDYQCPSCGYEWSGKPNG